jgi:hypothetical protein
MSLSTPRSFRRWLVVGLALILATLATLATTNARDTDELDKPNAPGIASAVTEHEETERPRIQAVIGEDVASRAGRTDFLRVTLEASPQGWLARLAGRQDSGHLVPQSRARGLLVVPDEAAALRAGDRAEVIVWRWPATGEGN